MLAMFLFSIVNMMIYNVFRSWSSWKTFAFEDVYELLIGYLLCYTIVCMSNTFSRRDNQLEDFVHLRSSV